MNTIHQRLYNSQWFSYRARFLNANPACTRCRKPATVVDHIIPHRGSFEIFWAKDNHQPLCKHCHDSYKQRLEKSGRVGASLDGVPLNPNHHWNKK